MTRGQAEETRRERAAKNARAITRAKSRRGESERVGAPTSAVRAVSQVEVTTQQVANLARRARVMREPVVLPALRAPDAMDREAKEGTIPGPAYTLAGEPMGQGARLDAQGRPRSVWSALVTAGGRDYRELCTRLYGRPDMLADALLADAVDALSWDSLPGEGGGWRVWLDRARSASVEVYP